MSLDTVVQRAVATAYKLKGITTPAVLTQSTPGVFDPATGTSADTTVTTPRGAVLDTMTKRIPGVKFGTNDLIQEGDLFATILAEGLTTDPAPGDTLAFRGATWTVKGVWPTFVGSTPVLFELWVRK